MRLNRREYLIGVSGTVGVAGCSAPSPIDTRKKQQPNTFKQFSELAVRIDQFDLIRFPFSEWPKHHTPTEPINSPEWDPKLATYGNTDYTHPLINSRRIIALLLAYHRQKNERFLTNARKLAELFLETRIEKHGAYWFPYRFDFNVVGKEDSQLTVPWFSGMAQGTALSAFIRLARTDPDTNLEPAEAVLNSLKVVLTDPLIKNESLPWVTVLKDRYYWIEEYPESPPNHVLNGKISTIFALYEYWCATGNGRDLLEASLTTIKDHVYQYRNESGPSDYLLRYDVQHERYHNLHIRQLKDLYSFTQEEVFLEAAEDFEKDYS